MVLGPLRDPVLLAKQSAPPVSGRPGEPLLVGQINVAPGPESTAEAARAALLRHYAFAPEPAAQVDRLADLLA